MNNGADVPAGVSVYAGQSGTTTNTAYLQSTQWPQFTQGNASYLIGPMNNAYKIGLQIRDLMLLVAFVRRSGIEFATAAGVHVPLNPPRPLWPCYLAAIPDKPQPPLWMSRDRWPPSFIKSVLLGTVEALG